MSGYKQAKSNYRYIVNTILTGSTLHILSMQLCVLLKAIARAKTANTTSAHTKCIMYSNSYLLGL